jgi:hypothetical protein
MNKVVIWTALLATIVGIAKSGLAQDVVAENKIRGLKGLSSLAIVFRPGTERDKSSAKEWDDRLEVILSRTIPSLGRSEPEKAKAWLELSMVTTPAGAALELSLYRWTKVMDSGEEIFTKVWWDSRYLFGSAPNETLNDASKEALEKLVTRFGADYFRANR